MPIQRDIDIYEGREFTLELVVHDDGAAIDWTGWDANLRIRDSFNSGTTWANVTKANGISLQDGGVLKVTLPWSSFANGLTGPRAGDFDLDLIPPSGATHAEPLMVGKAFLRRRVVAT